MDYENLLSWFLFIRERCRSYDDDLTRRADEAYYATVPPSLPTDSSSTNNSTDTSSLPASSTPSSSSSSTVLIAPSTASVKWEIDTWDDTRLLTAQQRLQQSGPPLSPVWYQHYSTRAGRYWDQFYNHNTVNFFKDRHYLEHDFFIFRRSRIQPLTLLELGCGVGNAFFPLVSSLPYLYVTAMDLSKKAIQLIQQHPLYTNSNLSVPTGENKVPESIVQRICAYVHDVSIPDLPGSVTLAIEDFHQQYDKTTVPTNQLYHQYHYNHCAPFVLSHYRTTTEDIPRTMPSFPPADENIRPSTYGGNYDTVLMLFMLSAMPPEKHKDIFRNAAACLHPGGYLLFRDYALWDEAQLRFSKGHKLSNNLFVRSDGTLAYYFTVNEIQKYGFYSGLEIIECRTLYRKYINRAQYLNAMGEGGSSSSSNSTDNTVTVDSGSNEKRLDTNNNESSSTTTTNTEGILRRCFIHVVLRKPVEASPLLPFC